MFIAFRFRSLFSIIYLHFVSLYFLLFLSLNLFSFACLESVVVCSQGRIRLLAVTSTTYMDKSSSLHNSSQERDGSHGDGLEWGLSRPTPPVNKKRHSLSHTSPLLFSRLTHNRNENNSCNNNNRYKNEVVAFVHKITITNNTKKSCYVQHYKTRSFNRRFTWWRHLSTTTRSLHFFCFLCLLGRLLFKHY